MRRRAAVAALLLPLALLAACAGGTERPDAQVLRPTWHEVTLPAPPGPPGRTAVRDATVCGGRWYLVGAVFSTEEDSRPAVWSSADARTWTVERLAPTDYWSQRSVLMSVGCRDGAVAMLGGKPGGAHGIPRVNSWYRRADGVFVDVISGYTQYGGPQGVSVGRIVGGPPGWLIAGNRTSGAAVWTSADATDFTRNDTDPQLSKDSSFDTTALDHVWDGRAWTVVGSATTPGRLPRVPLAWTSPDGRTWQREEVPAAEEFEDLERVVVAGDRLVAVGLRGQTFATWSRVDGYWRAGGRFGRVDPDGRAAPFASSLVSVGPDLLATTSDGTRYRLWLGRDGGRWSPVATPVRPRTAGEHVLTLATDRSDVLLLGDDGTHGRVWRTSAPVR